MSQVIEICEISNVPGERISKIFSNEGFHIAKWTSNIREVVNSIPVSKRAKEANDLDLDYDILTTERAFGLEQCILSYYSS